MSDGSWTARNEVHRICPSAEAGLNECVTDDELYWRFRTEAAHHATSTPDINDYEELDCPWWDDDWHDLHQNFPFAPNLKLSDQEIESSGGQK
jgi:hypothetical protein